MSMQEKFVTFVSIPLDEYENLKKYSHKHRIRLECVLYKSSEHYSLYNISDEFTHQIESKDMSPIVEKLKEKIFNTRQEILKVMEADFQEYKDEMQKEIAEVERIKSKWWYRFVSKVIK